MTFTRALAVASAIAAVALGVAGPARADQVMQGIYTYTQEGVGPTTWTKTPLFRILPWTFLPQRHCTLST